jgi:Tfp pilus assembly protein PilO
VRRYGKLSRGTAIALIVGGDLLLLLMGWFLLVSPQRQRAASTAVAVNAAQAQLQQVQRQLTTPPPTAAAAPKQPPIATANLYRLALAMPTNTDMPNLLLELDQVARAAGVDISTISPSSPVVGTGYDTIPIGLSVSGDFYSLTDLVYRLRTLVSVRNGVLDASGRLFSIDNVTLSPTGQGNQLSGTLKLEAYMYGAAASAPVAPAPAVTSTSTDTTSSTTTTTGSGTSGP